MANGTKKVVATTSVANAIPFNFNAKRSSTSFKLDEMVNQVVTIERAVDGKKDKTKRYVFMTIDGRPYAMEQGDLNETKGFKEVCSTGTCSKRPIRIVTWHLYHCNGWCN